MGEWGSEGGVTSVHRAGEGIWPSKFLNGLSVDRPILSPTFTSSSRSTWNWHLWVFEVGDVLPYHSGHNFPHDQFEIPLSQPCSELITNLLLFSCENSLVIFFFPTLYTHRCLLKTPLTRHTIFGSSDDKESACNAGAPGSILGWGRSPGEGNDNPL